MDKILLLGDLNSVHLIKWVHALSRRELELGVFSLSKLNHDKFEGLENLTIESLNYDYSLFRSGEGNLKKLAYLNAIPQVKKFIKKFKPAIVHAHYASSYGLIGALANFSPFIISVWGSDIYDFPTKNFLFKSLIKFNLSKADYLLSTSEVMKIETKKYTNKAIEVTPFGVDLSIFSAKEKVLYPEKKLIVGTVKALEYKYGIDVLIKAFALVVRTNKFDNLELQVVGIGSQLNELQRLAKELCIADKVKFLGRIDNELIPHTLNSFDLYVALSRWDSESFGVAIVEAQACELPVIVSNKGGLPEVVIDQETGIVVNNEDVEGAAKAIDSLLSNRPLRLKMGQAGRKRAELFYDWEQNADLMKAIYTRILLAKK